MHLHNMQIHIQMSKRKQSARKTLVGDARRVMDTCAGIGIRLAARCITRFMEGHMQGAGLSLAQFGLMAQIAAAGDDTIGTLAERSGLDQSTLSRNLRGLEQAGLVEIAIVESDLRRRAVWLTEKGARRLEAAIPVWERAHAALAHHIDVDGVRAVASSAATLSGSIRRIGTGTSAA